MQSIFKVASDVSTPIALAGVIAAIFFFTIRKMITAGLFPALTQTASGRVVARIVDRLFVLSLVALVLGFVGYVIALLAPHRATESNASSLANVRADPFAVTTPLLFKTVRIENVGFVYNTKPWEFAVDPLGEDYSHTMTPTPIRNGLMAFYDFQTTQARLPAGECYLNFEIENHGEYLAVLDEITMDITEKYQMPESALYNFYLPAIKPVEDSLVINATQSSYILFPNRSFKYAPKEIDKFRVKVGVATDSKPIIFAFTINAKYRVGHSTFTLKSDRTYFLAVRKEPTAEQVDARQKKDASRAQAVLSFLSAPPYEDVVSHLKKGDLREAHELLSKRIEALCEINKIKGPNNPQLDILSDDPPLGDCLFVRTLLRICLDDNVGADNDIEMLSTISPPAMTKMLTGIVTSFRDEFNKDPAKRKLELAETAESLGQSAKLERRRQTQRPTE